MVDNRPLPAKPTGAEAAAAFRAGQTGAKKSNSTDTTTSASKHKDKLTPTKQKRKSSAPTSPPHSPAALPASPPASGSGRKRKVAVALAERKEDVTGEDGDEDEDAMTSPLDAALADFVAAALSPPPPTAATQPLWLFQFPAKFDVATFSALRLSLPTAPSASVAGRIISRFQLAGEHYRIVEAESTETTDIVNLFPAASTASTAERNSLIPGRPFARVFRITLDEPATTTAGTASWQHTAAALHKKTRVPPAKGLTVHFRPIGYMADRRGQLMGQRRGKGFQKVRYEAAEVEEKAGGEDRHSAHSEKKRRKEERRSQQSTDVVQVREEVSEKTKKKKREKSQG